MSRLAGKVALVTGAGRGIGEACARKLAEHGAKVIVADIAVDTGTSVARDIGPAAAFAEHDVTSEEAWDAVVAFARKQFGGLDILVNNAGTGHVAKITDETPEQHRRLVELNLTSVWMGIRKCVPVMAQGGGGSIVNISSIDGLIGVARLSTYVATKFAVTGMTKALALELGSQGIRVNSVHPGVIETPLVKSASPANRKRVELEISRQPIPRMGRPEEIANAVLFFASDESSYCTGAGLVVDGGHIAGPPRDD